MARKKMVELTCGRCERVEYVEEDKVDGERSLHLTLSDGVSSHHSRTVDFDDLCTPCYHTVVKYVDQIAKMVKGKSPDRNSEAKKKDDLEAHPSTSS